MRKNMKRTVALSMATVAVLVACGGPGGGGEAGAPIPPPGQGPGAPPPQGPGAPPPPSSQPPRSDGGARPILFVTQQPVADNPFGRISSNFTNHLPERDAAPRGGHLWIAYPNADGARTLRNLSKEAGFGANIAARDPSVHWEGEKALVSLVVGTADSARWQVYEVTGLAQGQQVVFTRLSQPADYNNINAIYDINDKIVMVSDLPRGGTGAEFKHLHPHLDEYDEAPTNSGLWRLDPAPKPEGAVTLLHHSPSGAFRPSIDSFGRIVFTNWDHLQRDQQSGDPQNGLFNWPDESAAMHTKPDPGSDTGPQTKIVEVFPERFGKVYRDGVHDLSFNFFMPWMAQHDGTGLETLNHVGRHELGLHGFGSRNDSSLGLRAETGVHGVNSGVVAKTKLDLMHYLREDPQVAGSFYAVRTQEFGTAGGGCILKIQGQPSRRPHEMQVTLLTHEDTCSLNGPAVFRSPVPTTDGKLLASYSTETHQVSKSVIYNYRLGFLKKTGALYNIDAEATLTPGFPTKVKVGDGPDEHEVDATMWEWDAVEVAPRTRPQLTQMEPVPAPEASVFAEQQVDIVAFRKFLADNKLALIVSRNVTRRDGFDRDQPFNLRVRRPGGVTSTGSSHRILDVDHLQLFQAEQLRGVHNIDRGRRVLPQPLKPILVNSRDVNPPADANAPLGSVKVAADGSMAAIVPADRAMTWQLIDTANPGDARKGTDGVVRERVWNNFRPGEVRVCATCHGVSEKDQTGKGPDDVQNPPQALRDLLDYYKSNFSTLRTGSAR